MKADAKLDALLRAHGPLDRDSALHSLDTTRELREQPVAGGFEYPATMCGHLRIDHAGPQGSQLGERARLVRPDEPRITHNISRQDGCQPPTACLRAHVCSPLRRFGWSVEPQASRVILLRYCNPGQSRPRGRVGPAGTTAIGCGRYDSVREMAAASCRADFMELRSAPV